MSCRNERHSTNTSWSLTSPDPPPRLVSPNQSSPGNRLSSHEGRWKVVNGFDTEVFISTVEWDFAREMDSDLVPRVLHLVVSVLTLVLGVLGNVLLLAILHKRRLRARRSVHDILITNLAVADFLWVTLSTPTYVCDYFGAIDYSLFYCKVVWPVMTMAFNADIFTVTAMAYHRCKAISDPWRPRLKRKAAILWALGTWMVSLVVTLPVFIVTVPVESHCDEKWPAAHYRGAYTVVLVAVQYIVPLSIIAVSYASMATQLRRLKSRTQANVLSTRQRARQENLDAIRVLAVIVIAFALFMLPAQVVWLLFDFGGGASEKAWFSPLYYFADLLAIFHSCLNPLIYGFLNKKFRHEYVVWFSRLCPACPCATQGRLRNTSEASGFTTGAINNADVLGLGEYPVNVVLRSHKRHIVEDKGKLWFSVSSVIS